MQVSPDGMYKKTRAFLGPELLWDPCQVSTNSSQVTALFPQSNTQSLKLGSLLTYGSDNNFCYKAQESTSQHQGQAAPEYSPVAHGHVASQRWRHKNMRLVFSSTESLSHASQMQFFRCDESYFHLRLEVTPQKWRTALQRGITSGPQKSQHTDAERAARCRVEVTRQLSQFPFLNRSLTNPLFPITNVILWEKSLPTATVQSINLTGNQSLPLQEHF